jgi:hypothetical protein
MIPFHYAGRYFRALSRWRERDAWSTIVRSRALARAGFKMPLINAKLVTIISVFEVRDRIRTELKRLGASGMSIAHVEGEGFHGSRRDGLAGRANAAFSVVASETLASQVLTWVERELERDYPVIAWVSDVVALPGSHFA